MDTKIYAMIILFVIGGIIPLGVNAGLEPIKDSIQITVSPEYGALYFTPKLFEGFNYHNYTYTLDFLDFNESNIPSKLWLQIYNENLKKWDKPGVEIDIPKGEKLISKEVNVKEKVGEHLGTVKYRAISNLTDEENNELYNSTGPSIEVIFKDEQWEKFNENDFSYSVNVKSPFLLNIYLYYKNDSDASWSVYDDYKSYTDLNNWSKVSWDNAPYFNMVEFGISDEVPDHL